MTGSNQFISFQSFFLLSLCGFIAKSFHAKNPFIFITVFTIFILVDWSASVNEKPRQKCLSQAALILFTHTCPVTEFAVASHLNTANSCCHHVFLRHFRFQKCLPVYNNTALILSLIKAVTAAQIINLISHPVIPAAHQKAFTPPRTVKQKRTFTCKCLPVILKP